MKKIRIFLSALLMFLLFFLFCELSYRAYISFRKPLYRPSSVPDLGWDFTPGAVKNSAGRDGTPFTYFINWAGFRDMSDRAWIPWKSDEIKIVFIGDSVTAGADVNYEDTFSAVVEKVMDGRGLRVRTVNLGLDAVNTRQELAVLKSKALPLRPDMVILAYVLNDTESRFIERLPGAARRFLEHYHFGAFLSMRVMQTLRNKQTEKNMGKDRREIHERGACDRYSTENIATYQGKRWEETAKFLKQMADLTLSRGVGFGIVIFPFEGQISGACSDLPQRKMKEWCSAMNVPLLDMLTVYR